MNNFNNYFPCETPHFPLLMTTFSTESHFFPLNFLEENYEKNFKKNNEEEKCIEKIENSQMKFEFEEILEENPANFLGNDEILTGNSHGLDIMALGNIKAFADQSLSTASSIISSKNTINSMDSSKISSDSKKNANYSNFLKNLKNSKNMKKNKRKKTRKNSKRGKSIEFFYFTKEKINFLGVCKCKRSKCKKNFCECMDKGAFCNENCGCEGCGNSSKNQEKFEEKNGGFGVENSHFSKKIKLN